MTPSTTQPDWYRRFRSEVDLQPKNRGNVSAILVVLDRLADESDLRSNLAEILAQVPREEWRGWAALSLVVTEGEGQIAHVTGDRVSGILQRFGIAARYVGTDGGRSSRGNFRPVRRLLGLLPAERITSEGMIEELRAAQEHLISTLVMPELQDNHIEIEIGASDRPEVVIGKLLRQGELRKVTGPVAQHLVGAKLARRFSPDPIENFPVFASDAQSQRAGDFVHGHEAFHVTVVPKPTTNIRQRLSNNRERGMSATVLVPRQVVSNYQSTANDFGARLRSIEEFVGDNLMELGHNDRDRTFQELKDLIDTYNERVSNVERANSGLEIRPQYRDD